MSEQRAGYSIGDNLPQSLNAFKKLDSIKPHPNWTPPEPDQIKQFISLSGMNRRVWADLLGVTYTEKHGSTAIRKWCLPKTAKDYRQIPYTAWRLMLIYSGLVDGNLDVLTAQNGARYVAE